MYVDWLICGLIVWIPLMNNLKIQCKLFIYVISLRTLKKSTQTLTQTQSSISWTSLIVLTYSAPLLLSQLTNLLNAGLADLLDNTGLANMVVQDAVGRVSCEYLRVEWCLRGEDQLSSLVAMYSYRHAPALPRH